MCEGGTKAPKFSRETSKNARSPRIRTRRRRGKKRSFESSPRINWLRRQFRSQRYLRGPINEARQVSSFKRAHFGVRAERNVVAYDLCRH